MPCILHYNAKKSNTISSQVSGRAQLPDVLKFLVDKESNTYKSGGHTSRILFHPNLHIYTLTLKFTLSSLEIYHIQGKWGLFGNVNLNDEKYFWIPSQTFKRQDPNSYSKTKALSTCITWPATSSQTRVQEEKECKVKLFSLRGDSCQAGDWAIHPAGWKGKGFLNFSQWEQRFFLQNP